MNDDFTQQAAQMVADNDRIPTQRTPPWDMKAGTRVLIIGGHGERRLFDVEDVQPTADGLTLRVAFVSAADERLRA